MDSLLKDRYPKEGSSKELQLALNCKATTLWRRAKHLGVKRLPLEHGHNFIGYKEVTGSYLANARNGAKRRGLVFTLTPRQVYDKLESQGFRCVYSGRVISFKDKSASMDRIDSSRGYIIDNIQIVHVRVNMMKMGRSHENFIALIHTINTWRSKL